MQTNEEYRMSSILCFTKSWLHAGIPIHCVSITGFRTVGADRDVTSSDNIWAEGLLCLLVRWCKTHNGEETSLLPPLLWQQPGVVVTSVCSYSSKAASLHKDSKEADSVGQQGAAGLLWDYVNHIETTSTTSQITWPCRLTSVRNPPSQPGLFAVSQPEALDHQWPEGSTEQKEDGLQVCWQGWVENGAAWAQGETEAM